MDRENRTRVHALWLCGAGSKKLGRGRGYAGNLNALRVADEQHLRFMFADARDSSDISAATESMLPLKELMVRNHLALAEHVIGLAFVKLSAVYTSVLDSLTPEQKVVLLGTWVPPNYWKMEGRVTLEILNSYFFLSFEGGGGGQK